LLKFNRRQQPRHAPAHDNDMKSIRLLLRRFTVPRDLFRVGIMQRQLFPHHGGIIVGDRLAYGDAHHPLQRGVIRWRRQVALLTRIITNCLDQTGANFCLLRCWHLHRVIPRSFDITCNLIEKG
jgi:hypothetical protein